MMDHTRDDDYAELDRLVLPTLPETWVTAPGVDDPFAGADDRAATDRHPAPESFLPAPRVLGGRA